MAACIRAGLLALLTAYRHEVIERVCWKTILGWLCWNAASLGCTFCFPVSRLSKKPLGAKENGPQLRASTKLELRGGLLPLLENSVPDCDFVEPQSSASPSALFDMRFV